MQSATSKILTQLCKKEAVWTKNWEILSGSSKTVETITTEEISLSSVFLKQVISFSHILQAQNYYNYIFLK